MKYLKQFLVRRAQAKSDNQGSTLLTVIICIAFIGILGSLLFSVTMTNLKMKLVESQSKKNFYSCESLMEEIRTGAQETAAEAVKYVYVNDVLANYAHYLGKQEADRNREIQQKVIVAFLRTVLGSAVAGSDDNAIFNQVLTLGGYSINSSYFGQYLGSEVSAVKTWPTIKCDNTDPYAIRLTGIQIEYIQEGYSTKISSDIVITMPKFSFADGEETTVYRMQQPFAKYVLVADGAIISDNYDGITKIAGNVYSGNGGIRINGQNPVSGVHQVYINGDTIVTRGDITVSDAAVLNVGCSPDGNPVPVPVVWAKNLTTYTSDDFTGSPPVMNLNGFYVIQDDLTLNGKNSQVLLNYDNGGGGAYIGYTGTHDSLGSSIIINGSGSSLNMSKLNDLILAGRAHVSVEDPTLSKDANIMTGESVAFKSNQRAYLMPYNFLKNVLHNPVTEADPLPLIDIKDDPAAITYSNYVNSIPYKIAPKMTGTTILRYYYLNFANGIKADAYFKRFFDLYKNSVLNNIEPFSLGNVLLPVDPYGTAIHTVGNAMSYDSSSGVITLKDGMSVTYSNDSDLDNDVSDMVLNDPAYSSSILNGQTVGSLADMYSKACHLLPFDSTQAYLDTDPTVRALIRGGGVSNITITNSDADPNNDIELSTTDYDFHSVNANASFNTMDSLDQFWIVNGNASIDPYDPAFQQVFNGILIATGDITVCDNAIINGLLISTGESGSGRITLGNNVTVNGRIITTGDIILGQGCNDGIDSVMETKLSDLFEKEGTILNIIFKNLEQTVDYTYVQPASKLVDLSSMVSYENWKKIE